MKNKYIYLLLVLNIFAIDESLYNLPYNHYLFAMSHNSTSIQKPYQNFKYPEDYNNIKFLLDISGNEKAKGLVDAIQGYFLGNMVADQSQDVNEQLKNGIRAFKIPVRVDNENKLRICHTLSRSQADDILTKINSKIPSFMINFLPQQIKNIINDLKGNLCALDKTNKSLESFLEQINNFLENNPTELVQIYLDTFSVDTTTYLGQFKELLNRSGLKDKIYYKTNAAWPTTGEMIKDNKRLVLYAQNTGWEEAQVYSKYHIGFGTKYDYKTIQDLYNDTNNPHIDWGDNLDESKAKNPEEKLLIIDNYVTPLVAGNQQDASKVNNREQINNRINAYHQLTGQPVSTLMVDFYQLPNNDVVHLVNTENSNRAKLIKDNKNA